MNNQHSIPINSTAKRVIQKGVDYEYIDSYLGYHDFLPEELKKITHRPKGFIDFTGKKIGTFTVIGMCKKKIKNNSQWLVKCNCGMYEKRMTKALKNQQHMTCRSCLDLIKIRKIASKKCAL